MKAHSVQFHLNMGTESLDKTVFRNVGNIYSFIYEIKTHKHKYQE